MKILRKILAIVLIIIAIILAIYSGGLALGLIEVATSGFMASLGALGAAGIAGLALGVFVVAMIIAPNDVRKQVTQSVSRGFRAVGKTIGGAISGGGHGLTEGLFGSLFGIIVLCGVAYGGYKWVTKVPAETSNAAIVRQKTTSGGDVTVVEGIKVEEGTRGYNHVEK